jgi:hypothetical protein
MATTKKATKKATTTKATSAPAKKADAPAPAKPVDTKAEIEATLKALATAKTSGEKKGLRRKLRSLGHGGGLRLPKAPPQKKGA